MKLHTAGMLAALVTLAGLASEPAILNVLPEKYAHILTAVGIVLQAITKGIQQGGTSLVPRDP